MRDDDAALLSAWANGDPVAGRQLYDRHYRSVYRFFNTKVDRDIEDLVQDTFTACVSGRARFRGDGSFRAYLFGTARNVLRQRVRRVRVRGEAVELDECSAYDLSASPSTLLVHKAEQRLLLEALRRLPLEYQIALELYYWESLTGGEMAEILGVSEKGVRSRIHRARRQLEDRMAELADSPKTLESTVTNLEGWAKGLRANADDPDARRSP